MVEVTHLLLPAAQLQFLAWVRKGGVELAPIAPADLAPIERLTARFRDQPMDFADATLVLLAERTGVADIVTFDRKQFEVYRFGGNRRFNQLPGATTARSRRRR